MTNFFIIYACQNTPTTTKPKASASPSAESTPSDSSSSYTDYNSDTPTEITDIKELINKKCTYCHSTNPNSESGYNEAPKAITFDNEKEINNSAVKIKKVVADSTMPVGDITLTENEKELVKNWDIKQLKTDELDNSAVIDLITKKCTSCHSIKPKADSGYTKPPKTLTFDTIQEINNSITKIKKVVADKSMPKGKTTLTETERNLIKNWVIKAKTNEKVYTNIKDLVTAKCTYCHSIKPNHLSGYSKPPRNITFDTIQEVNNSITKIKSVVMDRSMPTGSIILSPSERELIEKWTLNNQPVNTEKPTVIVKTAPEIITRKCAYCHSATPDAASGYTKAPERLTFDNEKEMITEYDSIKEVIENNTMPINNITLTAQERITVIAWCNKQAQEEANKPIWSKIIRKLTP